jgi:hypothetical protein
MQMKPDPSLVEECAAAQHLEPLVLLHIAACLRSRPDALRLRLVCRHWREAVSAVIDSITIDSITCGEVLHSWKPAVVRLQLKGGGTNLGTCTPQSALKWASERPYVTGAVLQALQPALVRASLVTASASKAFDAEAVDVQREVITTFIFAAPTSYPQASASPVHWPRPQAAPPLPVPPRTSCASA